MREILFRAKRLYKGGGWTYGTGFLLSSPRKNLERIRMLRSHNLFDFVECDKETLGQFTGLTDKNGTKIFEGDIVNNSGDIEIVSWDTYYGWVLSEEEMLGEANFAAIEVIGNIHDNPELLEVEA